MFVSYFVDDEEGWEVVRRGRRSHGGSTVSLHNNNNNNSSHLHSKRNAKDTRSGSLNIDGKVDIVWTMLVCCF